MRFFWLVIVCLVVTLVVAVEPSPAAKFTTYLAPNELYPRSLMPLLTSYQEGALISVGTERSLMTAILAKKITSVVQIDVDPEAIKYNLINRELLQISLDREDYLHLRLHSSAAEWQKRALGEDGLMANPSMHRWWMANFKRDRVGFYDFHRPPGATSRSGHENVERPFMDAHYLYDDAAFARIHDLAVRGRIDVRLVHLQDELLVWSMLSDVRSVQPISLVDISNTWWDHFAGIPSVLQLSQSLKDIDPKALIVFTDRTSLNPEESGWSYHLGVPGDNVLILDLLHRTENRPLGEPAASCDSLLK